MALVFFPHSFIDTEEENKGAISSCAPQACGFVKARTGVRLVLSYSYHGLPFSISAEYHFKVLPIYERLLLKHPIVTVRFTIIQEGCPLTKSMTNWLYAEPSPVMSSKAINTSGLCDVSAICADA